MNSKLIIGLIAVVVVGIAAFLFINKTGDEAVPEIVTASFSDDSVTVEASFNNDDGTVTFTHPAVGTVTLPRAISASGARYANEDESIVFWEHQGEVTIILNGVDVFISGTDEPEIPAAPSSAPTATALFGVWAWERTVDADGEVVTPDKPETFALTFNDDGQVFGSTDCNGFGGRYEADQGGALTVGPLASTLMYCEGSQEGVFNAAFGSASGYSVEGDHLIITLEGGGEMHFDRE